MRRAALALAFVAAACGGAPQSGTACQPTVARMQPPQEFFDFVVGGSSQPERTRESLKTANFYGNDAIWVLLPPGGESPLGEKILAWRAKPGTLSISGRRLDGRAPTAMGRRRGVTAISVFRRAASTSPPRDAGRSLINSTARTTCASC